MILLICGFAIYVINHPVATRHPSKEGNLYNGFSEVFCYGFVGWFCLFHKT